MSVSILNGNQKVKKISQKLVDQIELFVNCKNLEIIITANSLFTYSSRKSCAISKGGEDVKNILLDANKHSYFQPIHLLQTGL